MIWIALTGLVGLAEAHSSEFGPTVLRARPDAPEEVWGIAEGWGVVHSGDGGANWRWLCEEAMGANATYDLLPWADGVALVATESGILRVGSDCSVAALDVPEGLVIRLARWGDVAVAGWVGDEASLGGLYLCDDSACTPTALLAENWFPKSLFVDGTTLWATVVDTTTLAATLWRIDGGADPAAASLELSSFEAVHEWPLGDSDPRVYFASGERVDLWVRPRSGESAPSYQQSFDGGASFEATFETGYYSDPVPGVLIRDAGGTILLGSYYGARTWRSIDAGQSFEEVSAEVPALRCGLDLAPGSASGRSLICADHLADGFDVAATDDGSNFTAVACFEEVVAADCAAETCDGAYEAWSAAAAYGGGECGVDTASDDSGDTGKAEPECGCANGASSSLLPMLAGVGLLWWRVRTAAGSIR